MEPKEIRRNLNRLVQTPDGIRYKFTGATIRLNEAGEYWYQAELQDMTAERSVRICRLSDAEAVKGAE